MTEPEERHGDGETRRHGEAAGRRVAASPTRRVNPLGTASDERPHPLVELTLARVREFVREPEALFWVFVFPVLLAFALGIAFRNTAPEKTFIAVEAPQPGASPAMATQIAEALSRSPDLQVKVMSAEEAAQALRTGKVSLVVRASDGKQERARADTSAMVLSSGKEGRFPYIYGPSASVPAETHFDFRYDPTRPESRMARLVVDDALQRAMGRADVARISDEEVTEPGARYIDFLVPGLIGLNLMGSGMWGLGFAVVQARTRKLLKRLAATPMRRSHFLLSFMLSRLTFLVLEVAAVIIFAWLVFDVSVHGSLISLVAISLIGSMTFAGLGMLVAARPKTIEGVSGWMNFVMLPMWLLSGTFFSASRFPDLLQPFIKVLPLTALNDSLRAVINEGAPIASTWPEISVLLAWGLVSFALALRMFRWQ
ncbi:MAG: ABC transporter permease [Blastocatellia bacterium]|nr:ABC transporter permease [Blastocatellia bacterium]